VNSKVQTLTLRTAAFLVASSLSLTGYASLAQTAASSQSGSQASGQAASQASGQASSQASGQASGQASSQASGPAYGQASPHSTTKTTNYPAGGKNEKSAAQTPSTVVAKGPDLVALQGPTLITQKGTGWKTASTFLDLKDGQQALPLTFTVTNGANSQAKMQGVRMKLNGHEILTEKAFKDRDSVSVNLSAIAGAGQSQLIIETYGPTGATLSWVLTTLKIKVSDIKPVNCKIGDVVKISGKNFPVDKTAYKLLIDQTSVPIKTAAASGIDFVVPTGLTGGKRTVTLYIAGVKCDPLYIKIAAAPEVTGCNLLGAAPGGEVKIQGKGFSTVSSENQILLKSLDGQIISTITPTGSTDSELTAVIPMDFPAPSEILCSVKTNGQESPKGVTFSVGLRVIDKGMLQ